MEDREKVEHQIELATKAAAMVRDESTAGRFRRFADELRQRLFRSSRKSQILARAYELWDQAGRPTGRDLDFWLAAEQELSRPSRRPREQQMSIRD
jgi:hypothetical protein